MSKTQLPFCLDFTRKTLLKIEANDAKQKPSGQTKGAAIYSHLGGSTYSTTTAQGLRKMASENVNSIMIFERVRERAEARYKLLVIDKFRNNVQNDSKMSDHEKWMLTQFKELSPLEREKEYKRIQEAAIKPILDL